MASTTKYNTPTQNSGQLSGFQMVGLRDFRSLVYLNLPLTKLLHQKLFFSFQGCRLDFEFVAKGFMYRKGRMKITVSKIHRQISPNAENCEPLTNSHLVLI